MSRGRPLLAVALAAGFGPAAQAHEPTARALFSDFRADVRSYIQAAGRPESSPVPHVVQDAPVLSEPLPSTAGSRFRADATGSLDNFRSGISTRSAPALKLAPVSVMDRTGWGWSGRLGPVRWLGPLDGESGELTLRLQRIPSQPRPEGLGRFYLSIHFTFD